MLVVLPVLLPVLLAVAVLVWATSCGPVLFRQKRVGREGRLFTLVKFRTLEECGGAGREAFTTRTNQCFTRVGPLLRRWKLDELPQLWNVLAGDMSLVGPRPKTPELTVALFPCRPGITGAATLAFANEEVVLDRVPAERLQDCYHRVVLPAKLRIDAEYMERATLLTDLRMLAKTLLRRWDSSTMEELLRADVGREEPSIGLVEARCAEVSL